MTETQQKAKCITLKGSAELVKQYLLYGINSILYQRGIYPPETFLATEYFGLYIFMSTDKKIKTFLDTVLGQIQEWLLQRKIQKLTLIITNVHTKEVLEKWDFKVEYEDRGPKQADNNATSQMPEVGTKDNKTIQKEIREVMRQITGTISFLPLLDCLCSFDILTYTVPDCDIPNEWDETQPVFISNSQEVELRTFSTSLHKMATIIPSYIATVSAIIIKYYFIFISLITDNELTTVLIVMMSTFIQYLLLLNLIWRVTMYDYYQDILYKY